MSEQHQLNCFVVKVGKHTLDGCTFPGRIVSRIVPGMKITFGPDYRPKSAMNEFTVERADQARKRGRSWLNTQNSYNDDLYQFATYMHVRGLDEDDIGIEDIEEYAFCLIDAVSVRTKKKLKPATLKRRVNTVLRYFRWRISKGLDTRLRLNQISSLLKNGIYSSSGVRHNNLFSLTPEDLPPSEKISPFFNQELASVLDTLGPPHNQPDGRSRRDRLASELSYATGMRLDEICSLTVQQIVNLRRHVDPDDPYKSIGLRLSKTKGLKPGEVFLPSALVEQLLAYVEVERAQIVTAAKRRSPSGFHDSGKLFLNGKGANHRDFGRPLQPDTLSRRFSAAVYAAGLQSRDETFCLDDHGIPVVLEDGSYAMAVRQVNSHTFHDLRHTFAVNRYLAGIAVGEKEPWKKVQILLRHKSLKTTIDIYLQWVETKEGIISDAHFAALRSIYGIAA
jgi:site-specific recombinase XerD